MWILLLPWITCWYYLWSLSPYSIVKEIISGSKYGLSPIFTALFSHPTRFQQIKISTDIQYPMVLLQYQMRSFKTGTILLIYQHGQVITSITSVGWNYLSIPKLKRCNGVNINLYLPLYSIHWSRNFRDNTHKYVFVFRIILPRCNVRGWWYSLSTKSRTSLSIYKVNILATDDPAALRATSSAEMLGT